MVETISSAAGRRFAALLTALMLTSAAGAETWEHEACYHGKAALAEEAAASYDEDSGRDLRNYPPDRVVDHLHMKLEMRFDELEKRRFTARETLRVKPIAEPVDVLELNAVGLNILSVATDGVEVETYQDDTHVILRFDPPLDPAREHEIIFEYTCDHPYAGMMFTPASEAVPSYTAEVHTQGQAITNRHWFIAHDAPNERLTTELVIDVPAQYAASSNGRLVEHRIDGDRAIWHWRQDQPHVNYLVSLVIGEFDIVPIPHDRVSMQVWAPKGTADLVLPTYGRTGAMIDVFEKRFGVPYPWDRYDQLIVKNFGAGGMENTSASTMYPTAIFDETALRDADLDGLIAHELAHQWTGDLITCKEWAHIWLNEGFATYGTALWMEHRDGEDGYLDYIRGRMNVAKRDKTTNDVAMVSPVYTDPWQTFRRAANPYPKGSSILHMLRKMLGEETFWEGIHLYMNRHAFGVVETNDLRYALEEVSGQGLEWFFDQWCFRPGSPRVHSDITYDAAARELLITVEQTQHIDARTPAFRFQLPVHVKTAEGWSDHTIDVSESKTTFRRTLESAPQIVAIDPELAVLGVFTVHKPASMWLDQLAEGPTVVAKHRAVTGLADRDHPDHRAALDRVARDAALYVNLRIAAVDALGGLGSTEAKDLVRDLHAAHLEDPRLRAVIAKALARQSGPEIEALLAETAENDPSYATRKAAITALGDAKSEAHAELLTRLVHVPSQHDQIREAALLALGKLDDERGLDLALQYAAYGYMDRSRAKAIEVIGTLGHHDADRAMEALLGYLHDPLRRPARAAGGALAKLGDERGLDALEAVEKTDPNPGRREDAEGWVKTLRKSLK